MHRVVSIGVGLLSFLGVFSAAALLFQPSLETLSKHTMRKLPGVENVSIAQFLKMNRTSLLLLDARSIEEFEVGRIPGAIWVDPEIEESVFKQRYAARLKNKNIVFYCSVGRRSSQLIEKLQGTMKDMGASKVSNLNGGIFNWANQGLEIEGGKIHPYNAYWGRLIQDKSKISYRPF